MKKAASSCSSSKNNSTEASLADLTNKYKLTPFSSLSKLCNSTPKNAPSSISGKENRVPNTVFNFSNSKSNKSVFAELTTPTRRVAPPPTPPLGEGGSGEHSYNLRRSDVKCMEAIYGLSDSSAVENDSQKGSEMPSSSLITHDTILNKNLGTVIPSSHLRPSLPVKYKDKGNEVSVTPLRPTLLKTKKDKGKAIAVSPIQPDPPMTLKKGIVFVNPSDETRSKDKTISSPFGTQKVKGIEIGKPSVTSGSGHLTRDRDKRKASSVSSRHPVIMNDPKGKVKEAAAPSRGLLSETKKKDALLTPVNLSSKKAEHKGKSIDMPSDCQPPFELSENFVKEMEIFTCPPLPRTRSSRKRTTKDKDSDLPNSWTDPPPRKPKSRRVRKEADKLDCLPKDFVEKHRAYFKEVDEFELLEEEISGDDLDKD